MIIVFTKNNNKLRLSFTKFSSAHTSYPLASNRAALGKQCFGWEKPVLKKLCFPSKMMVKVGASEGNLKRKFQTLKT